MAADVELGIAGLAKYAAQLAVSGQEEQLSKMRQKVELMAAYWLPPTLKTEHDHAADMVGAFDAAVIKARESGYAEALSDKEMAEVITGLQTHMNELRSAGDELDCIPGYKDLCDQLRQEWFPLRLSVEIPPPAEIPPGGLTLDEWIEANRPRNEAMQEVIQRCIPALAAYAGMLTVEGLDRQFSRLKSQVDFMTAFWLGDDESVREEFLRQFDETVAAAKASGQYSLLTEDEKTALLDGLKLTIWETHQDLDDDSISEEFEDLLVYFKHEWGAEPQAPQMDGINL